MRAHVSAGKAVPYRMCRAGGACEVSSLRVAVPRRNDYGDRSVSGSGPALTEACPNRIWAVLRRSERCEAQWLRRMLALNRQAARQALELLWGQGGSATVRHVHQAFPELAYTML